MKKVNKFVHFDFDENIRINCLILQRILFVDLRQNNTLKTTLIQMLILPKAEHK